jgi:TonB family protein
VCLTAPGRVLELRHDDREPGSYVHADSAPRVGGSPQRKMAITMTSRSWRNRAQRLALCACAAGLLPLVIAPQKNEPKPVKKVMPAYPDVRKRMGISGTVRLHVTIAPDGSVKDVEARGGSAIFAEAVTKAVKEWCYPPSDRQRVSNVSMAFECCSTVMSFP